MKHYLRTSLLALSLLTAGSMAQAATKNVIINANVVGTCAFDSGDVTINMGNLQAGAGDQRSEPVSTEFWCSNGQNYTVTANNGLNADGGSVKRMLSGEDKYLPYTLTLGPTATGVGKGPGTPINLTLTAEVKGTDLDTAEVDAGYTDTVTLTVNP